MAEIFQPPEKNKTHVYTILRTKLNLYDESQTRVTYALVW